MISFGELMDICRSSLMNMDFGIFTKACDHEVTAEIGWLLYSNRQQEEERILELLPNLIREKIGVKGQPICSNDCNRKEDQAEAARVFALHIEGAADKAVYLCKKLSTWYGASCRTFPNGTKIRLVPPYNAILSCTHKGKFAALIARQAALSSRLCSGSTWELSTNLILDHPEPSTRTTLRKIIMDVHSQILPDTPLFHLVDRLWRSTNSISFSFLPENQSDARAFIAGLVPFIRETSHPWFMRYFSEDTKLRHLSSRWHPDAWQTFSAEDELLDELLTEEMELKTNIIANAMPSQTSFEFTVPPVAEKDSFPTMYRDEDSVSTFNPRTPATDNSVLTPSSVFQPRVLLETRVKRWFLNSQIMNQGSPL
jgi:hypothetical protein